MGRDVLPRDGKIVESRDCTDSGFNFIITITIIGMGAMVGALLGLW